MTNSTEADFRPLLEAYRELGCKGVGEYIPNLPFDDPLMMQIYEVCENLEIPLLFQ